MGPRDLVVVGGGAAGLAAARAARRRGATVHLVAEGPLGGDCTWTGCIPSKTLVESAAAGLDASAALARVRAVVASVAATESAGVLRGEGIDVVAGRATLVAPGRLEVDGSPLAAPRLVLATGAVPGLPAVDGLAAADVLTTDTVWDLDELPPSLVVVGGGPVGVELAQAMARLGTAVTLVEGAPRVLPGDDPAASQIVAGALAADGVALRTGAAVVGAAGGSLTLADGSVVTGSRVLVAGGRTPEAATFAHPGVGLRLGSRGEVAVDDRLRTSVRGVWAAGDVTGRCPHTHAADEMGRIAAGNALAPAGAGRHRWRGAAVPVVTYTDPEVARVGMGEAEAAVTVPGARVVEVPMSAVDRAVTAGRTEGYVKLVVGPRRLTRDLAGGRLLGASIVAPHAGEMIAVPTLALRTGMWPARLALTVQAYPTWSLAVRQAAAQLFVEVDGRRARPARPG